MGGSADDANSEIHYKKWHVMSLTLIRHIKVQLKGHNLQL